jgi:hypothetical protein
MIDTKLIDDVFENDEYIKNSPDNVKYFMNLNLKEIDADLIAFEYVYELKKLSFLKEMIEERKLYKEKVLKILEKL